LSTPPPFTGFSAAVPKPADASVALLGQSQANEGDDVDGDDEGIPILEPEKVLKNESDTDIRLLELPCKLFRFKVEGKEWADMGKGTMIISKQENGRQRVIVRNLVGKVLLNAYFYKDMKIEKVKALIQFSAVVADDTGTTSMRTFSLKVNAAEQDKCISVMRAGVIANT
jgi:hypothetical protein